MNPETAFRETREFFAGRGFEMDKFDVTVLCRGCHAKFHDKVPRGTE